MSLAFSFFLRLFLCFVAARFFLQAIDVDGRDYLVGLTILLLANVYFLSYLIFRDRPASPAPERETLPPSPAAGGSEGEAPPESPAPPGVEPEVSGEAVGPRR